MTPALSRRVEHTLSSFLDELYRWNRRVNLTRVPREQAWVRHIEESLQLVAAARLARHLCVVDIGAGAGVPGLVAAVVRRDLEVTLLEADTRKVAFLIHAAGMLGLRNVSPLAMRAETAGRDPRRRESYDAALARAVAPPSVLLELGLPLVRPGGRLCTLVAGAAEVAQRCENASAVLGGGRPRADGRVLRVEKLEPTPSRYPRRPGVPARHPLA